jgi:hypothetical protein
MKKAILYALFWLLFSTAFFGGLMYATSAKCWYAGEHTKGCNNSDDCGCYKKLLAMDKQIHDKQ